MIKNLNTWIKEAVLLSQTEVKPEEEQEEMEGEGGAKEEESEESDGVSCLSS